MTDALEHATRTAGGDPDGYADSSERPPLGWYALFVAVFNGLFGGALLLARRQGRELPDLGASDIILAGVASHKVSRIIGKDKVMSPLRAPFTELQGPGGPAEFEERSRGTGLRKALGELLICPYCLGLWVVGAFSVGLMFVPRVTRLAMSMFASLTLADFLQIAYRASEEKGLG